jgi:DNA-binding response OmpR family regulator
VAFGGVSLLRWPEEDGRRSVLAAGSRLRLLLVDTDAPAPVAVDPREDWVRLPASEQDIEARVTGLLRRAQRVGSRLQLDGNGLLHRGDVWVPLPETEASLMAALLAADGSVVSRAALVEAAWPGGSPTRNVLDVHMVRLRRRVAELGVEIRTVRSRGYALARR